MHFLAFTNIRYKLMVNSFSAIDVHTYDSHVSYDNASLCGSTIICTYPLSVYMDKEILCVDSTLFEKQSIV